jgi:Ferritin-like domain
MARTRRELLGGARGDGAILRQLADFQEHTLFMYETALRQGRLDDRAARLARTLRDQEQEHLDGLSNALKGYGGRRRYGPLETRLGRGFPGLAAQLEARNVRACYEAIAAIRNVKLLPGVGAIMASDAQHLALWRELLGRDPVPRAFETGARVD